MKVRRVRLLAGHESSTIDLTLRVPRARRVRGALDHIRVRSVWLKAAEEDVSTKWGWKPADDSRAEPERQRRHPSPRGREAVPDGFLEGLRDLLRPNLQAILRREEWPHPLHSFQEHGVLWLYERNAALLADEMGLGKTVQALAAASLLLSTGEIRQVLVLCPAPLVSHWMREARKWLPRIGDGVLPVRGTPLSRHLQWRARAPVLIAGNEVFRADFQARRLPEREWDLVILDEAQRIKNDDTELAHACKTLPRRRSWALTGTPLENRVEDIVSILEWVLGQPFSGLGATGALRDALARIQLRRTKEGVALQLPPKTVVTVLLDLDQGQRETYDRLERDGVVELRERGERLTVTHVLALLTRLKQVCNFCPRTGESAKLSFLRPQLQEIEASGRQALVFSQFTDERAGIGRLARELDLAVYHGGMSATARDRIVARFNEGEMPALALSLRAGGVGLNLQRASYVFHFDRWWNPAVEWQAEDRAHRLGQKLPVTVYRLVTAGTIEERIHAVLEAKAALFREVVEGIAAPPASRLTLDELFGLLALPVPTPLQGPAGGTDVTGLI